MLNLENTHLVPAPQPPREPQAGALGQAVPLTAPCEPPGVLCSLEEVVSKDEQSTFRVQLRVTGSAPDSLRIKTVIGSSWGIVQRPEKPII